MYFGAGGQVNATVLVAYLCVTRHITFCYVICAGVGCCARGTFCFRCAIWTIISGRTFGPLGQQDNVGCVGVLISEVWFKFLVVVFPIFKNIAGIFKCVAGFCGETAIVFHGIGLVIAIGAISIICDFICICLASDGIVFGMVL